MAALCKASFCMALVKQSEGSLPGMLKQAFCSKQEVAQLHGGTPALSYTPVKIPELEEWSNLRTIRPTSAAPKS